MCGGIVKELEAVEDLHGASPLHPYHAAVDPRSGRWRRRGSVSAIAVVVGVSMGPYGRVHLRPNPSIVIRNVHNHQWMQFECQSAARRGRHSTSRSQHRGVWDSALLSTAAR